MKIARKISLPLMILVLLLIGIGALVTARVEVRAQGVNGNTWQDADIGSVPVAGATLIGNAGSYTISSASSDIWDNNDNFHYLYQSLGANGQIVARVSGLQGTNEFTKAGVMLRETLDPGSRNAMMLVTLSRGSFFQWRSTAGGLSDWGTVNTNASAPYWVKIVRNGDWVGGYGSTDGVNWTLTGWQNITGLAGQVYLGLAVASHQAGFTASAVFDNVAVGPADAPEILAPVEGIGDGLMGNYFSNRHLSGQPVTNRVEGPIDFDFWNQVHQGQGVTNNLVLSNQCMAVLGMPKAEEFGIRWKGELQAQFTEPYTLYADVDDGVRVWLNEQLIIDDWTSKHTKQDSATVNLVAGKRYLLRIEYFQNKGFTRMQLAWSSPSTPRCVVPQSQLYSQPILDANGGGLPINWELHYFGQTNVDANADSDGDGLSNLQEYQRATDPTSPLNWGVPNEWAHGDIEWWDGSDGNASYSNGVFTVSSSGVDYWWAEDTFHYLYQSLGTNGEIVARLSGIQATNDYAKAGVMLRETLDSGSRQAMMGVILSGGSFFRSRSLTRDSIDQTVGGTNAAVPYWVKIVRSGDWIGGYDSADGTNWTMVDWQMMPGLPNQVYVGMAVTANNAAGSGGVCSAQFDQVYLGPANPADILNPVEGTGDGLLAQYRNDSLLYLPGITNRVEPTVRCDFGHGPPFGFLNPDSYGISWSGEIQAQFTEPYQFSVQTHREDWVRVWINEQLVIDGWRNWHDDYKVYSKPMDLVAGQRYLIRVEMYDNFGHGAAILRWKSPSTPEHVVSQSQLYSQPIDTDRNGMPDLWQLIYFGHTGVDPNADPDGDGLSNLQEYKNHTNPTKGDTDADGLPDAWEVTHGLDPQFNDAALDLDNSGWNNLQKYVYGLDPLNPDVNGDGLPDILEVNYLGVDVFSSHADLATVAASATGAQGTNFLGKWQVDGSDIYAVDRRGGLDFNLTVNSADKYVLNLIGTQNRYNPRQTKFKLLLGIDGQTLGHYTLNAGYGTNGQVEVVLPYLKAGAHTLHVFWDGAANLSSLRIKGVKLLSVAGADANQNGIKDWADKMIADESGMDATNPVIGSYTSPACLEGRDPYAALMFCTNNLTNALTATATTDRRWYVNVPLQAGTQTVFQASYQNGALAQSRQVQWLTVNLFTTSNALTIRQGDSLLFSGLPPGRSGGTVQITVDTNNYTGNAARPVPFRFTKVGIYSVAATYTAPSGATQSGVVTVDVVQQNLPNVQPAAWTWMQRNLVLPSLAPEATLQADSRLSCTLIGTNANGQVGLTLATGQNEPLSLVARLGTNGPVLDSTQVMGFDLWSGDQTRVRVLQVYADGSQLVEMPIVVSPVNTNVTFVLDVIVSGVMFDDGTTQKTLTSADFDALGQYFVHFIRPASARTSVCHSIRAYQGNYQVGYRH